MGWGGIRLPYPIFILYTTPSALGSMIRWQTFVRPLGAVKDRVPARSFWRSWSAGSVPAFCGVYWTPKLCKMMALWVSFRG